LFSDDFYTFEAKELEKVIKSLDTAIESDSFGHNAAITNFVNKFEISIDNVPTCGFVSISLILIVGTKLRTEKKTK
jgi:hypothetical protein